MTTTDHRTDDRTDHHEAGEVALSADFTGLAGEEEALARIVKTYAARVRQEAGNIAFDVYLKADSPSDYVVFERYTDADAFAQHCASAHAVRFNVEVAPLIVGSVTHLTMLRPSAN